MSLEAKKIPARVEELKVWFPQKSGLLQRVHGHFKAVDGISFAVQPGSTYGLVGESGSGKSTTAYALMGLQESTAGKIFINESEMPLKKLKAWKSYRKDFQIIFQDFNTSLNPRSNIEEILTRPLLTHKIVAKKEAKNRAAELLEMVGLEGDHLNRYPHAFSGGQRQRINIARALALEPKMLVCDEIVSALDVSVQAQILELLKDLREKMHLSMLFIAHDLAVVKNFCHEVGVMQKGKIVEQGSVTEIFNNPQSEYTQGLLQAVPKL